MNKFTNKPLPAALASLAVTSAALAGPTFGFRDINAGPSEASESRFALEVLEAGPGQVQFVIRNEGTTPSAITHVFFDNGNTWNRTVQHIIRTGHSERGVSFRRSFRTRNLPGGKRLEDPFQTSPGLSAAARFPWWIRGVNPGEQLSVLALLRGGPGNTLQDVLDELNNGQLRIGLQVRSFGEDDRWKSFVNTPLIPAPSAVLLTTLGLVTIRLLRSRQIIL